MRVCLADSLTLMIRSWSSRSLQNADDDPIYGKGERCAVGCPCGPRGDSVEWLSLLPPRSKHERDSDDLRPLRRSLHYRHGRNDAVARARLSGRNARSASIIRLGCFRRDARGAMFDALNHFVVVIIMGDFMESPSLLFSFVS